MTPSTGCVLVTSPTPRISFDVISTTLPGVTRHFNSITAAAWENGMSRVYGGIHFRHAVRDGFKQGQGIGREVSRMLPRLED
jgi:hypothetical protein